MFKNGFSWLGIGGELKDNVLICLEMASTGMVKGVNSKIYLDMLMNGFPRHGTGGELTVMS